MESLGTIKSSLENFFKNCYEEDDLNRNLYYALSLPRESVRCRLFVKSSGIISGLPYFFESFQYLMGNKEFFYHDFLSFEGSQVTNNKIAFLEFELPFNIALTGERIALNLLQHASSISTYTHQFVKKADKYKIKILDTRKTTPGLRALEKYAVRLGGGVNHRFGQTDLWMIKDNHKSFFGGVGPAIDFFKKQGGMYTPIELEVHTKEELQEGLDLNIKHFMLDNFSPNEIKEALLLKREGVTFEVSGGISLDNLDSYLMKGIDAISVGALTYAAPAMDFSFKYARGGQ